MTRILMVYTSADKALDGSQTGYYLPEAAHPYYAFKAAKYDIDFVAPKGPNPPVDKGSVQVTYRLVDAIRLYTMIADIDL